MPVSLERSYSFSASHLYYRPEWSEERNRRTFGKCAQLPGHGHNYRLTVRVQSPVDPETGFSVDLPALDEVVRNSVVNRLDHRHINDAVENFALGRQVPTTENLVRWAASQIALEIPAEATLIEVRLAEDDRLASVWTP